MTKHDVPNAKLAAWYTSLRAPCCPTQLQTALTLAGVCVVLDLIGTTGTTTSRPVLSMVACS